MSEEKKEYQMLDVEEQPVMRDFEKELIVIIRGGHPAQTLKELLEEYHESDLADVLPKLDQAERKRLYAVLDNQMLAEVFAYLDDPSEFAEELAEKQLADIATEMPSDDAVDLLEELDEQKKQEIISLMDEEAVKDVQLITAFDEDQIGSLMTNDFVCINHNLSVKESMKRVIKEAGENSNISTIFVVDNEQHYLGAFYLRDLVIARSDTPLEDIIMHSFPFVYANSLVEDCLQSIKDYAEAILPVLSADNKLIGALTSSDVVEAVDEDLTENYAKLAGLPEEALDSSIDAKGIFRNALKRLPWLLILLFISLFIGTYIGIFESVIIALPILVNFQQLISGMSGNAGTQTLAVTIKALDDPEFKGKQKALFVFKELRIGVLIGLVTGLISAIAVGFYAYLTADYASLQTGLKIGGALGLAMLASSSSATLTGCIIPIVLDKLNVDPATASGPLITTLNDFIAVTVYYGIAILMLL